MSIEVTQFLEGSNFTENAPRPPVPGEENELCSNGGQSTKSSGSRQSIHSSKSAKSGHSPSATPRRSNLDKGGGSISHSVKAASDGEEEAPLGFEPEGSASNSPPFTEASTPAYRKWGEDLKSLLDDGDGVMLFKKFLKQEDCANVLEFYFACEGLKSQENNDRTVNLIKAIYKKYIRGEPSISLKTEIRNSVQEKLTRKVGLDTTIFDDAQNDIEINMKTLHYPMFLKSDLYVQYIQNGGESPPSSASGSGSSSARPLSTVLPSLPEDAELQTENLTETRTNAMQQQNTVTLTKDLLRTSHHQRYRSDHRHRSEAAYLHSHGKAVHPYYTSYAPVSAVDSELASLSSDALTDDTMSLTDSSVDGYPMYNSRRNLKRMRRNMQASAQQNRDTQLNTWFLPRTDPGRVPKDRNVAETEPKEFAAILIEKLEVVLRERESKERMHEKISNIQSESEESEIESRAAVSKIPQPQFQLLMAAMNQMNQQDDNDQSILDDHCSRVFESNQQTPSRSPRTKSPHRHSRSVAHAKAKNLSYYSLDSGVDEFENVSRVQKHIHQHHHHYYIGDKPKMRHHELEKYAQKNMVMHMSMDSTGNRGRTSKKPSGRKSVETSSNIDSGVSMAYEPQLTTDWNNPSNEKVLTWMMENEKMTHGSSTYSDSEKSSSHKHDKRSHKSSGSACASPLQHRQGVAKPSKAPVQYNASRSGSLDRSGISNFVLPSDSGTFQVKPSQPFIQDPSMPLMTPPNSTTTLEEAKRRLVEDSKMAKSKSFPVPPPKEKRQSPISHSGVTPPPQRTTPSSSSHHELDASASGKKTVKKSTLSTSSGSVPAEITKVAYFFCGEPIPYTVQVPGKNITLGQFKNLVSKKGDYRFFFKKASDEFGTGVVHEELMEDSGLLPLWAGKIIGRVEKKE